MNKSIQGLLYFFSAIFFFASCNKDEVNALYGPPSNLAPPIYEQLKSRDRFNSFLAVIDKAGYTSILGKAGYWTLFAPNDDAFAIFMKANNISSVDAIDKKTAENIVRYSSVYNAYRRDNISTYENPQSVGLLEPGRAFRKKSAYYDFVYEEKGKKIIAANTNFFNHFVDDNNNKYVPIFTQEFFSTTGLTVKDYETFFPGSEFKGFNVAHASVVTPDILAANGMIHEVDRVLTPAKSIDQYLASNPDYSEFKKLLDSRAIYLSFYKLQTRYTALTGLTDSVHVKLYPTLPFSPGNENYYLGNASDAQASFFSIAVPRNAELIAYKNKLLENWGSNELSPAMLRYLIEAHMWITPLWPSKMASTGNTVGENPTFNASNIVESKMLSNGNLYGLNTVQEANVFRTVYSKPFLNFNYQLQTRGLNTNLFTQLKDPDRKFGLIMQSDTQFQNQGYTYNSVAEEYSFKNPSTGATIVDGVARARFFRILNMTAFDNSFLNLRDLSGEGVLKGSPDAGGGEEYVKYKNNQLFASGNADNNTPVTVTKVEQTLNGPVFYTTGTLLFSEKRLGISIRDLAAAKPASFSDFYDYLRNSTIWLNSGNDIDGISLGLNYTVMIPTNTAMRQAVRDGKLPGTVSNGVGVPNFAPTSLADRQKVIVFLLYHFLEKQTVAPDGDPLKQGSMLTALKDLRPQASAPETFVFINSRLGIMEVRDAQARMANLILANSNNLADRTLIHSIDKALYPF